MKSAILLVATVAATFSTAAAQSSQNPGSTSTSTATMTNSGSSSSKGSKSTSKAGKDVIVRSGGQGHNSGPAPKGKIVVAPTTPTRSQGSGTKK